MRWPALLHRQLAGSSVLGKLSNGMPHTACIDFAQMNCHHIGRNKVYITSIVLIIGLRVLPSSKLHGNVGKAQPDGRENWNVFSSILTLGFVTCMRAAGGLNYILLAQLLCGGCCRLFRISILDVWYSLFAAL
jgi:hypothetical protein